MNIINFDFQLDGMKLDVEAGYENDGGRALITSIDLTLRGENGQYVDFDPDGLLIVERDADRRTTGNIIELFDAIRTQASEKAQAEVDEQIADEADARADQHKNDRTKP